MMTENEISIRLRALIRERLVAQATVFQCNDMISALLGKSPSMYDVLVGQVSKLENAAKVTEEIGGQAQPVAEPTKVAEAFKDWDMIERQPDKIQLAFPTLAENPLKFVVDFIPNVGLMRIYELGVNNIASSNVSAFAYQLKVGHKDDDLILMTRIFTRYKGGTMYRYSPLHLGQLNNLVTIATTMAAGGQAGSTVGQYIANVIKPMADNGLILCEKLNPDGEWVVVQPKLGKGTKAQDAEEKPVPKPRPTLPSVKTTNQEWGGPMMGGEGTKEAAQIIGYGGSDPISQALARAFEAPGPAIIALDPAALAPPAPEVVEAQPETKSAELVGASEAIQAEAAEPVGEEGPASQPPIEAHAVEDAGPTEEAAHERTFFLIANDPVPTDKGDVYEFQAGFDNGPTTGEDVLDTFTVTVASEGGKEAIKAWQAGTLTDDQMYHKVLKRTLPEPPVVVAVAPEPEPEPEPEPVKDADYFARLFDVGATVGQQTVNGEKVGDDTTF